jgi:hypothetical protein
VDGAEGPKKENNGAGSVKTKIKGKKAKSKESLVEARHTSGEDARERRKMREGGCIPRHGKTFCEH